MGGILELSIPSHPTSSVGAPLPRSASGSVVTVAVMEHIGNNRWQVLIEGTHYQVASTVRLLPGSVVKAQLIRSPFRILLKVLALPTEDERQTDAIGKLLASLGLPDDRAARLAVEALQQSGLTATREATRALRVALERSGAPDSHLARLAALLIDRRFDLSQPLLDLLYRQVEGWIAGSDGEGSQRREDSRGQREGSDRREGEGPESERGGSPLANRIAAALREQLRASGPDVGPLALFNHHPAGHDRWVVLPFALRLGSQEIRGSARFLFGPDGRPSACSIVVAGEADHPRTSFALSGGRPRRLTWFLDGAGGLSKGRRAAALREAATLRENLRNLGIEVDDTMRDGDRFDGFSERRASAGPLDRSA